MSFRETLGLKFGGENIDAIYKDIRIHTEIYEHNTKTYTNENAIVRYLTVHIMGPQRQGLLHLETYPHL